MGERRIVHCTHHVTQVSELSDERERREGVGGPRQEREWAASLAVIEVVIVSRLED